MSVKLHGIKWGAGQGRRVKAESGWKLPLKWARDAAKAGQRRKVFALALSLGDILDEEVDRQPAMRVAFDRTMDLIRQTHSWDRWTNAPGAGGNVQ